MRSPQCLNDRVPERGQLTTPSQSPFYEGWDYFIDGFYSESFSLPAQRMIATLGPLFFLGEFSRSALLRTSVSEVSYR